MYGGVNSLAPTHFRDLARNAIYQQLPATLPASSVRLAPLQLRHHQLHQLHRLLAASVFLWGKRLVRLAPSIYSSSTGTIPEDSEPTITTVEQFINDIALHEAQLRDGEGKILLGLALQYQNVPELLVDWNLNVTRCKLMLTGMPLVLLLPDLVYSSHVLPQLVGDLAHMCHIVLLSPHISDKELIYTLYSLNLYQEHELDASFMRLVAEISVKQLRLLQISQPKKPLPITHTDQLWLLFGFKEIAIRNYLVNLAAAATTAYEYRVKSDAIKRDLKAQPGGKRKLLKDEKKRLWDEVRLDVFRRAGLET